MDKWKKIDNNLSRIAEKINSDANLYIADKIENETGINILKRIGEKIIIDEDKLQEVRDKYNIEICNHRPTKLHGSIRYWMPDVIITKRDEVEKVKYIASHQFDGNKIYDVGYINNRLNMEDKYIQTLVREAYKDKLREKHPTIAETYKIMGIREAEDAASTVKALRELMDIHCYACMDEIIDIEHIFIVKDDRIIRVIK